MSWLNADTYQPLALPQAHCSPTITMAQGGPGLITEDAVFPVTQIPELVPLASLTTSSPMHQNQSWTSGRKPDPISGSQNSVHNCSGHVPAKCRIICILRQGAEMKRFILTIRSKGRSSRGVDICLLPRVLRSGCPCCLLHCRTVLMYIPASQPKFSPPRADNCTVWTTRQFSAKRAPANFGA